jgi:hypothetical protein
VAVLGRFQIKKNNKKLSLHLLFLWQVVLNLKLKHKKKKKKFEMMSHFDLEEVMKRSNLRRRRHFIKMNQILKEFASLQIQVETGQMSLHPRPHLT